jgi:hypothetical protein
MNASLAGQSSTGVGRAEVTIWSLRSIATNGSAPRAS